MKSLQGDDPANRTHQLKTWPEYFQKVKSGFKGFEVRKDDRNFQEGDVLELLEWNPDTRTYTGESLVKRVGFMLRGGSFGIEKGYVVIQLEEEKIGPIPKIKRKY